MAKHGAGRNPTDAKARPGEAISLTLPDSPRAVTRNGREQGEWEAGRQGSLATFLAASPLCGSGIEIERLNDGPRELEL